jgi:hypothetical protein
MQLVIGLIIASMLLIGAVQRFDTIIAKKVIITSSGGLVFGINGGPFDLNGKELILDADADSGITCDTDDQCDWELGGQDEYVFTAAGFDIGEGTLSRIDFDADNDTSIRSIADDELDFELGGSDVFSMTATSLYLNAKILVMDEDQNTSITASTDNQIDFELGGNDQVVLIAVAAADSAATNEYTEIVLTTPVDTTGTNTHNLLTLDLSVGNSTGGANNVRGIQIDAITDDPQVVETAINIGDEWDVAIETQLPIVGTAVTWMDDFLGDTVLAQYTEINGADGQAVQAIKEEQFGAYAITSGDVGDTDANDLEAMYLSLEWQADQGALIFETRLHLDTDITTTQLCVGFTDDVSTAEVAFTIGGSDVVTAVAEDAVMFCFDTRADTDEWFALGVANTTKATGNGATGTPPAAGIYQTLRIEIDDGGLDCRFYIDGTLVKTLTANCITVTDPIAPGFVISSAGTADSNTVDIDYMFVAAARD